MLDTYLIAMAVFFGVVIFLVAALLLVESKVVLKGDRTIVINEDPDKSIQTPTGTTLARRRSGPNARTLRAKVTTCPKRGMHRWRSAGRRQPTLSDHIGQLL